VKNYVLSFLFSLLITNLISGQSASDKKIIPFSNELGLTLEIGGTIPNTDYNNAELDISGRLMFEYFFGLSNVSSLGIRLSGNAGRLNGSDFSDEYVYPPVPSNYYTGYFSAGGGLIYTHTVGNFIPYLSFLISGVFFNPLDENGYKLPNNQFSVYNSDALLYTFETGIRFPFNENWSLNLSFNYNLSNTDYLDDINANSNNDAFLNMYTGISYYINFRSDKDNDGVSDDIDLCPETPEGMEVNEFGCSSIELQTMEMVYDSTKDHFLRDGIFSDGNLYCFQVDVFQDLILAKDLQDEIRLLGYRADIFVIAFGSRDWYSVRIGYFDSFEKAKTFKVDFFKRTSLKLE